MNRVQRSQLAITNAIAGPCQSCWHEESAACWLRLILTLAIIIHFTAYCHCALAVDGSGFTQSKTGADAQSSGQRRAATAAPASTKAAPNIIASAAELKRRIPHELHATKPDYIVYVPQIDGDRVRDTGNEHFLVFDGPDGSLMAIWTQSTAEAQPDQHIVFVRSDDEGLHWTAPKLIAGPARPGAGHIASWAFPLVSRAGRIYVLYSQHVGKFDTVFHMPGRMDGIYSDDNGQTWSAPETNPMPRSKWDNPDPTYPASWIVYQKPQRLTSDGKYLAGFTRWTSLAVTKNPTRSWISMDSRVEFMRFENLDENPPIAQLKISYAMSNDDSLSVPFPGHEEVSVCQEPGIVKLPDGRLFCVMRTAAGSPFWSLGTEDGKSWTKPKRLLRKDGGSPLAHPLSPCPIYDMQGDGAASGRYVLLIHNHDGHYHGYGPTDTSFHRRPVFLVTGRYHADGEQPVWFDEPQFFMDHDGVALGAPGTTGRLDLALYSSFTVRQGQAVLWYPDRKFFLLGRKISETWFGGQASDR